MQTKISCKVSFHEGNKFSQRHNVERASGNWNKDGHINPDLIDENVILIHVPLKDFFDETFFSAIEDFNSKNRKKHPDRVTSVSEYYQKYKSHARESIFQLGDAEEFEELSKAVGIEQAREIHKQFLTSIVAYWLEENPNLRIFGAYIHCDEEVPHLHLDYLPVSESSKGLRLRVSRDGALSKYGRKKGFKKDESGNILRDSEGNAIETEIYAERKWVQWEKDTRDNIESMVAKIQLTAEQKKKVQIEVVPHDTAHTKHEEKFEWEARAVRYYLSNPEPPEVPKRPSKRIFTSEEVYLQKRSEYKEAKANLKLWERGKELAENKQFGFLQTRDEQLEKERQAMEQGRQELERKYKAIEKEKAELQEIYNQLLKAVEDLNAHKQLVIEAGQTVEQRKQQLEQEIMSRVQKEVAVNAEYNTILQKRSELIALANGCNSFDLFQQQQLIENFTTIQEQQERNVSHEQDGTIHRH